MQDQLIAKAVSKFAYSQMELASFLNLHYSTISRIPALQMQQQSKELILTANILSQIHGVFRNNSMTDFT